MGKSITETLSYRWYLSRYMIVVTVLLVLLCKVNRCFGYHLILEDLGLGLCLQGLYSATNCADNILGRFTIIRQIKLQE